MGVINARQTWWTWTGRKRTRKAHLRWSNGTESLAACGRGPAWYVSDDESWRVAPDDMPRCTTCRTIAGNNPSGELLITTTGRDS